MMYGKQRSRHTKNIFVVFVCFFNSPTIKKKMVYFFKGKGLEYIITEILFIKKKFFFVCFCVRVYVS